jgi:hypothetical protein
LFTKIVLKAMVWAIGFGFLEVQAKPKPYPGQSRRLWLGLRMLEAKASGFQAKPSQARTSLLMNHRV